MIVSFSKVFTALFFVNIGFMILNVSDIFPEKYVPSTQIYSSLYDEALGAVKKLQATNPLEIITFLGAMIYLTFIALLLAISIVLLSPIVTAQTLDYLFGGLGGTVFVGIFTIIFYISFFVWVNEVIRTGRLREE